MYTLLNTTPSKFAAKTRRGISQNIDRLDTLRDVRKSNETEGEVNVPKPVFHQVNGKKAHSIRAQQEAISPQHEEIIKFIYDSWTSVCKEGEQENSDHQKPSPSVVYYEESEPNHLQDFKAFDLESWWGKRLFNTITKSIP